MLPLPSPLCSLCSSHTLPLTPSLSLLHFLSIPSQVLSPIPKPITATLDSLQGPRTIIRVGIPSLSLTLSPTTVRLILHVVQSLGPDKVHEKPISHTSLSHNVN